MYNLYTTQRKRGEKIVSTVISFRIDDEERDALKQIADEHDATISWAARRAIKQYLANLSKESEMHEDRDNLLLESDGVVGKIRVYTISDDAQSEEHEI